MEQPQRGCTTRELTIRDMRKVVNNTDTSALTLKPRDSKLGKCMKTALQSQHMYTEYKLMYPLHQHRSGISSNTAARPRLQLFKPQTGSVSLLALAISVVTAV